MLIFTLGKRFILAISLLLAILKSSACHAFFNPIPFLDEASDLTAEASGLFYDVSSLANELGGSEDLFEDIQNQIREVSEIEDLARETGYDLQDLEEAYPAIKNARDARATIRALTQMIRTSKKLANTALRLATKAKLAQVENADVNKQILLTLNKMSQEHHQEQLSQAKKDLLEIKKDQSKIKLFHQELKKKGAKVISETGLLTFPKGASVTEQAISVSTQLRKVLLSLILGAFLIRVVFHQFGFKGSLDYGSLISKTILCILLLSYYPEVLRTIDQAADLCNDSFGTNGSLKDVDTSLGNSWDLWLSHLKGDFKGLKLSILSLQVFFEGLKYGLFLITDFIFNFGKALLILIIPIVIFMSQMFGFSLAWGSLLGTFFMLSLWPLFWNMIIHLAYLLGNKESVSVSDHLYSSFFLLLQVITPGIGILFLKNHLGSPAKETKGAAASGYENGKNLIQGSTGSLAKMPEGGRIGYVASWAVNQILSRTGAAFTSVADSLRNQKMGNTEGKNPQFESSKLGKMAKTGAAALKGAILNERIQSGEAQKITPTSVLSSLKRKNLRNE